MDSSIIPLPPSLMYFEQIYRDAVERIVVAIPHRSNHLFVDDVKWLLAIPHYIVLSVLGLVVPPVSILGWIVILVTGSQPRWIFQFMEGYLRWWLRVAAYAYLLTTDRYPPFRLD